MKIAFFDIEYTAWEGSKQRNWEGAGEYREVIQVGATVVDVLSGNTIDDMIFYVKPKINPNLSDYIKNLTGIEQENIDNNSYTFQNALEKLANFVKNYPIWVYGTLDLKVLRENCNINELREDVIDNWEVLDISSYFELVGIETSKVYSGELGSLMGIPNSGLVHNALSDAKSLAGAASQLVIKNVIKI